MEAVQEHSRSAHTCFPFSHSAPIGNVILTLGVRQGLRVQLEDGHHRALNPPPREFTSPKYRKVRATSDLRIHLFYSLHFSNQETLLKHANMALSSRLICCELRNESSAPDTLIWLRDDLGYMPLFSVFFLPPLKCYCKIVWGSHGLFIMHCL